jgi:hypothetical protein
MVAGYTKRARMTDTNTGWRKRQIALDIKAENARELGLDYAPDKTIEMAREAGFTDSSNPDLYDIMLASDKSIEAFAKLVREDERNRTWTQEHWTEYERSIAATEREACANTAGIALLGADKALSDRVLKAIRARGQA